MKRITLLILILLFVFSPTTLAQEETTYNVGNFFTIAFPADWKISNYTPVPEIQYGSPYEMPMISVGAYRIPQQNLDDLMCHIKDMYLTFKENRIEESGSLYIDGWDARWVLISQNSLRQIKYYRHRYVAYSDQYRYEIQTEGKYDNLETDRKAIDKIISSIKILK